MEDAAHPVFKDVPQVFNVTTEEWYTRDRSPRPKVRVLANVDENSYKFTDASQSGIKMGDHPVVWTYEGYQARNLFIFMGHHPNLFQNAAYTTLLRNALFWAANKETTGARPGSKFNAEKTGALDLRWDTRLIVLPAGSLREVMVLDASGRALYHARGESPAGRIDRSGWGAGDYLLRATTATGAVSRWIRLDRVSGLSPLVGRGKKHVIGKSKGDPDRIAWRAAHRKSRPIGPVSHLRGRTGRGPRPRRNSRC